MTWYTKCPDSNRKIHQTKSQENLNLKERKKKKKKDNQQTLIRDDRDVRITWKFKVAIKNPYLRKKKDILEAGGKIGSLSKGKVNVSKEMKTTKKNQMKNLEKKNTAKK